MYLQHDTTWYKTTKAEQQAKGFYPVDSYQAVLNKLNKKSKTNRKWIGKFIEKQAAF